MVFARRFPATCAHAPATEASSPAFGWRSNVNSIVLTRRLRRRAVAEAADANLASDGRVGKGASRPGAHFSVGADFRELAAGMARNIADGRAIIVQSVYERE